MYEIIINITCAIISVVLSAVAIIISIVQFRKTNKISQEIDRRETNRYREQVTIKAKKFITKYNETDEIQLIALCMTADLFDSVHPYRRSIYKEWCALGDDVKKEILRLRKFDIGYENFYPATDFLKISLSHLKEIIDEFYGKEYYDTMFYDGAKYFLACINEFKEKLENEANYYIGDWVNSPIFTMPFNLKDAITDIASKFDLERIIRVKDKEFSFIGKDKPLNYYFSTGENYCAGYICCLLAIYCPIYKYSSQNLKFENYGFINDFAGFNDWYLEDLFLQGLLNLNLYREINLATE